MTIHGKQQTVKGTVLFFLADTIRAHEIGGFKLGLSLLSKMSALLRITANHVKKGR